MIVTAMAMVAMLSMMIMAMRAVTVSTPEMVMAMPPALRLPDEIIEPEEDQRTTGDPRKDIACPLARLDAKPSDEDAEHGGEQDVA